MNDNKPSEPAVSSNNPQQTRRRFLKATAAAGGAVLAAPYIGNAEAAKTTTWKIQTSWPGGIGLEVFKDWCDSIIEKTGGELAFQPFGAKDVVGEFQLFDAVKNGVLDAMNPFTLYWAGRMPVAVFLSSYPLGLRNPHEWDVFYYALGGLELAREAFGKMGLYFVGPVHHGPNIIHSKVPIRSIDDFAGRVPDLSLDASTPDGSHHRSVLAYEHFGAFVAGDGAVHLHDGRDGALLPEAAQAHDFIVKVHRRDYIVEARGAGVRTSRTAETSLWVRCISPGSSAS